MPRNASFDNRLNKIVSDHLGRLADAIALAVKDNLAGEIQKVLSNGNGGGRRGYARVALPRKKRILPCIAPRCTNPSKGPRFHYLCDEHKNASARDRKNWQKAKRDQRKAA